MLNDHFINKLTKFRDVPLTALANTVSRLQTGLIKIINILIYLLFTSICAKKLLKLRQNHSYARNVEM